MIFRSHVDTTSVDVLDTVQRCFEDGSGDERHHWRQARDALDLLEDDLI